MSEVKHTPVPEVPVTVTATDVKYKHNACYSVERLNELYPGEGRPLREVLALREGEWASVPDRDRVWTAIRYLSRPQFLEFLARLVERALGRVKNPDPRSLAVAPALRADTVAMEKQAAEAAYAEAAAYAAAAAKAAAYAAEAAAAEAAAAEAAAYAEAAKAAAYAAAYAEAAAYAAEAAAYAEAAVYAAEAAAERQAQVAAERQAQVAAERQAQVADLIEIVDQKESK